MKSPTFNLYKTYPMIKYLSNKDPAICSISFLRGLLWPAISSAQNEKPPLAQWVAHMPSPMQRLFKAPAEKIEKGTIVMKDGLITAFGLVFHSSWRIIIKADSMFVLCRLHPMACREPELPNPKKKKDKRKWKDPGNPPPIVQEVLLRMMCETF